MFARTFIKNLVKTKSQLILNKSRVDNNFIYHDKYICHEKNILTNIFCNYYYPPTKEDKIKKNKIVNFFIKKHPYWNNYCLWISTKDKEYTMCSKNLIGINKNYSLEISKLAIKRTIVNTAFRNEIDYQVAPFRKKGYEVDHQPPFSFLRDAFITNYNMKSNTNIGIADIDISYELIYNFTDRNFAKKWKLFHAKYAKLETVTREENIKRSNNYIRRFY
jgi:hypothetical protein